MRASTARTVRTAVQVAVAVMAAVPSAVALLDLPASTASQVGGIAGAIVVLVTAGQNAIEDRGHSLPGVPSRDAG